MSQFTTVIRFGRTITDLAGVTKMRALPALIPFLALLFPLVAKMVGKRLLLTPAGRPLVLVKYSGFDCTIDSGIALFSRFH